MEAKDMFLKKKLRQEEHPKSQTYVEHSIVDYEKWSSLKDISKRYVTQNTVYSCFYKWHDNGTFLNA